MPADQGPWVVRAYFDDERQLNLFLRRAAPWSASVPDGVLTIDVANRFEYQRMLDEGFRIAIDTVLTEQMRNPIRSQPGQINGIVGFTCYRTVEETFASADALVLAQPGIVQIVDIGDSWAKVQNPANGYDLKVLRLTNRSISGPKPVHYLMGAIHAREYVTAETVTRYAEWLVSQYGINPDVTWVLDHHEVHILLHANPDGRKVAEISSTQLQRKNRNQNFCNGGGTSLGVDMNRNFPFDWAGPGSSPTPCAENFRGPSAASELESQSIIAYLQSIFPDQRAENPAIAGGDLIAPVSLDATGIYMDVHSNAARNWFSWGNSATTAPNGTQLQTLGRKLSFYNGYRAEVGSAGGAIGGATDDFIYGTLGVPAFTVEMDGSGFFPACSSYENAIAQKNIDAFWMASKLVRAPLRLAAGPELINATASPASVNSAGSTVITVQASDNRFAGTSGGATEPSQNIASVQVYLTPPWQAGATAIGNMSASDGSFNSANESATFTLAANLLASGQQLVYLQSTDQDGNRGPVAAVFVTRTSASGVVINAGNVNFGNIAAGFTSPLSTVTLSNEGVSTLTVSALVAPNAPFARTADGSCSASVPFNLAAGSSCTLTYNFSPSSRGLVSQNLNVTVTGGTGSGVIALAGTGIQGELSVSSSTLNFGTVNVGASSAEQTVTLNNIGNTIINISALSAAAGPFSRSGGSCSSTLPFTVLAGSGCTLRYTFTPSNSGQVNQLISIASSGANNGSFSLNGTGAGGVVDLILADGFE
jgi:hypothetical protein